MTPLRNRFARDDTFWTREDIARYLVADGLIRAGKLHEGHELLKHLEIPHVVVF